MSKMKDLAIELEDSIPQKNVYYRPILTRADYIHDRSIQLDPVLPGAVDETMAVLTAGLPECDIRFEKIETKKRLQTASPRFFSQYLQRIQASVKRHLSAEVRA